MMTITIIRIRKNKKNKINFNKLTSDYLIYLEILLFEINSHNYNKLIIIITISIYDDNTDN